MNLGSNHRVIIIRELLKKQFTLSQLMSLNNRMFVYMNILGILEEYDL